MRTTRPMFLLTVAGLAMLLLGCAAPARAADPTPSANEVSKLRAELRKLRTDEAYTQAVLEMAKSNLAYWKSDDVYYDTDFNGNKYPSLIAVSQVLKWQYEATDAEFRLKDIRSRIAEVEQRLRELGR